MRIATSLYGFCGLILITACGGSSSTEPSSPTSGYTGQWRGQTQSFPNIICGSGIGANCSAVQFTVNQNNTVTCFTQATSFGNCTPDTPISSGTGVSIQGNQFQIGDVNGLYSVSGVFDSPSSAHGTLVTPVAPNGGGSNGTTYNWTASKQ